MRLLKECLECGHKFTLSNGNQKYCTSRCSIKHIKEYLIIYRQNEEYKERMYLIQKKWREENKEKLRIYRKSYRIYAQELFSSIKKRLIRAPTYKNRKLTFSNKEFLDFIFNKSDYPKIHESWVKNNFNYKLSPTVDRIDNKGNYSLGNIRIITKSKNSSRPKS